MFLLRWLVIVLAYIFIAAKVILIGFGSLYCLKTAISSDQEITFWKRTWNVALGIGGVTFLVYGFTH